MIEQTPEKRGFVAIDSDFYKELMQTKRAFTRMEAAFCFTYDLNYNRPWSINQYAKLFGWSRHKTRDFLNSIMSKYGSVINGTKNKKGHPIRLVGNGSDGHRDPQRFGDKNKKGHPKPLNGKGYSSHEDTKASIGTPVCRDWRGS